MPVSADSRQITKQSGSNFIRSFWFLTKAKREALTAIYAYCRITDDIVDLASTPDAAKKAAMELKEWRANVASALEGKSGHPVLSDLSAAVQTYGIPHELLFELIDGVEMDLFKKSYAKFDELYPYCYKVAGVVGLISLQVFGASQAKSKDYAINLGIAFQLTNIARDIASDASRGRIYIPEEDLRRFGLAADDIAAFAKGPDPDPKSRQMEDLIRFECARAEEFYAKAKENLTRQDRTHLLAAEAMCGVYHSILRKIEKNPLSVFHKKIHLGKSEALWRVLWAWVRVRLGS